MLVMNNMMNDQSDFTSYSNYMIGGSRPSYDSHVLLVTLHDTCSNRFLLVLEAA